MLGVNSLWCDFGSPPASHLFSLSLLVCTPQISLPQPCKRNAGESGIGSSSSMTRSGLGSENQGTQVSLPRGVHEGPDPVNPRGLHAFNLTTIFIPRDSFQGQRPGVTVLPSSCAFPYIHLCICPALSFLTYTVRDKR